MQCTSTHAQVAMPCHKPRRSCRPHGLTLVASSSHALPYSQVLANPSYEVQRTLERTSFLSHLGKEWVFVSVADAVAHCMKLLNVEGGGAVEHVEPIRKYSRTPPGSVRGADEIAAKNLDAAV